MLKRGKEISCVRSAVLRTRNLSFDGSPNGGVVCRDDGPLPPPTEPNHMDTIKTELLQIATHVNRLLTSYISIHDSVFRFNWRHAIPLPFIFKPIDYPLLQQQAVAVVAQLRDSESALRNLRLVADSLSLPDPEIHFLHFMSDYVLALIETLVRLETVLNELRKKAEDPFSYKYSEYQHDLERYREAVAVYKSMGGRLNEVYYQLK
jgi:hypothetical protein